jgi:DNA-binding transcriptional ArsR family regulator
MQKSGKIENTFQRLRLIDRIDRAEISRGAADLLRLIERRASGKWLEATSEVLAAWLKVSSRSISRYVAELREAGFLDVWRRVGRKDGLPKAAPSRYRVRLQAVVDAAARDLQERAAVLAARAAAAWAARVERARSWAANVAKMARHRDQDFKKEAWEQAQAETEALEWTEADEKRMREASSPAAIAARRAAAGLR